MEKKLFRNLVGNKIFTVTFEKKDGTLRVLNGRLDVKKHLKGGSKGYDKSNLLTVYDLKNKGYRTVNLDKITKLKTLGLNITV